MLKRAASAGFTLVEILTGMTIIAVLIGVGMPTLAGYLQGAKLSSAASSYYSGMQQARAEAIRRNVPAEFVLTDAVINTPTEGDRDALAAGVVGLATGRNWVVRASQPAASANFAYVEAKAGVEGAFSAIGAPSVEVEASGPSGFDGSIAFNGFGRTVTGGNYTVNIRNPAGGACEPGGPMRCQRVRVNSDGRIVLCDPRALTGDSRFCGAP